MTVTVIEIVGEGVLRIPKSEGETRRFGMVALVVDGGRAMLTGVPKGVRAQLVAVKLKKVTTRRRRWLKPGVKVRTKAVEIPVLLGEGEVFTAALGQAPTPDAIGVKPARPAPRSWLDVAALREVEGRPVRLELHRTPDVRRREQETNQRKEA